MSNMGYCRFRNTLKDLRDCYENMEGFDELSKEEELARERLIKLCKKIADEFEVDEDRIKALV